MINLIEQIITNSKRYEHGQCFQENLDKRWEYCATKNVRTEQTIEGWAGAG
jgi:hypothetical protein